MKRKVESEHFQKKFCQDTSVKTMLDWNSQCFSCCNYLNTWEKENPKSFKFHVLIYTIYMYILFMIVLVIIADVFERKGC